MFKIYGSLLVRHPALGYRYLMSNFKIGRISSQLRMGSSLCIGFLFYFVLSVGKRSVADTDDLFYQIWIWFLKTSGSGS
jgi:hypothetical protein